MISLILLVLVANAYSARVWPVNSAATLLDAVRRSIGGDQLLLEPGDYVLRAPVPGQPVLIVDHPLTIASRDPQKRAILRTDGASILMAITSPSVMLKDLIVGKQVSGGDERSIDVYIASGTQTAPASRSVGYGGVLSQQALESRGEILSAREVQTRKRGVKAMRVTDNESMRALNDIVLSRVDFTRSQSGTNVAFARGSYADVNIGGCVFGREGASYVNAIAAVSSAQFVSLGVHGNAFVGGAHVLFGSESVMPEAIGLNYWGRAGARAANVFLGQSERRVLETYCLTVQCDGAVAPIVDADDKSSSRVAYATFEAAFAAGVRHVRLTDDFEIDEPVVLVHPETTIEGGEGCDQESSPVLTISTGGAIIATSEATLAGVRNLRVHLRGARTAAFVFTDGSAQRLAFGRELTPLLSFAGNAAEAKGSETSVVLVDGVSVLGDGSGEQVAFLLSSPAMRVELQDALVMQTYHAAVVHRGVLVAVDSTFVGTKHVALYAETATHQAGLRVSGSTFVGCDNGIELGSGASTTALHEFSVQCSSFLFNTRRVPLLAHDCAKKPAICAAAVRYNTIVSSHPVAAGDEQESRMWRQGANHVEHGRDADQYVYAGEPRHFSLRDDQGRLSWVSGSLVGVEAEFIVASYAPVRTECLVPGDADAVGLAQAAVVSDVLEVRADSLLHQCSAFGVRFRIGDEKTLPESLAIYGVASLGTQQPTWTRALASTQRENGEVTLEATLVSHDSAQRHQHRVVVVALELAPDALSAALDNGAALINDSPRAVGRRLCVVCGNAQLPARALDEFCGGTTENVRDSFDDAYEQIGFGFGVNAPRHEAASLFVFGECVVERRCTAILDQNEHIEGYSDKQPGALRHMGSKCAGQPLVHFTPRASKASLRNMVLDDKQSQCAIDVASSTVQPGPQVSNNFVTGGFCVQERNGGRYVNNEIAGTVRLRSNTQATSTLAKNAALLFEANVLHGKLFEIVGGGEFRITRNLLGAATAMQIGGTSDGVVHLVGNKGIASLTSTGDRTRVAAIDNTFVSGAHVSLSSADTLSGGADYYNLPAGVVLELGGKARLLNTIVPRTAILHVKDSVVLREVAFEEIGASLNPKRLCAHQSISAEGLDLARSQLYSVVKSTGDWVRVLTADEQRSIAADASAFWRRSDGVLARCEGGVPFQCGCRRQAAAINAVAPPGVPVVQQQARVLQDEETGTSTLAIVLAVVGAIVLVCICIACIVGFSNMGRGPATVAPGIVLAGARAHEAEEQEEHVSNFPVLSALRVRKAAEYSE